MFSVGFEHTYKIYWRRDLLSDQRKMYFFGQERPNFQATALKRPVYSDEGLRLRALQLSAAGVFLL